MSNDFIMKDRVCERCGKWKRGHTKTSFHVNGREAHDIGWIRLCAGSGYERDIDLCEDCMEELAEWMEGPTYTIATPMDIQRMPVKLTGAFVMPDVTIRELT